MLRNYMSILVLTSVVLRKLKIHGRLKWKRTKRSIKIRKKKRKKRKKYNEN
jgi:hypothetical protein